MTSTSCAIKYEVRYPGNDHTVVPVEFLEVVDGDTIRVVALEDSIDGGNSNQIKKGETNSVRFLFIDTMESVDNLRLERLMIRLRKKHNYIDKSEIIGMGTAAKSNLINIFKGDKIIKLELQTGNMKDIYGRWLAVVFYGGTNINYLQIQKGVAVLYLYGPMKSPMQKYYREMFYGAENLAKRQKVGIWKNFIREE